MLFGGLHPAIRIAIGLAVLIIWVALHKVLLDVAGGAVMIISTAQWLSRARR